MEGKFYTKLWFIMCMSILMPPFVWLCVLDLRIQEI